jgi:hypothetical protein
MKKRFTPNGKKVVFASSLPGKSYSLSPLLLGEVACNPWLAKMSLHQPYGSFVYNYLCNQCRLSLLKLWVITAHGQVYSIQLYMIEFVCDLQQVCGFLWAIQFPHPKNWPVLKKYIFRGQHEFIINWPINNSVTKSSRQDKHMLFGMHLIGPECIHVDRWHDP